MDADSSPSVPRPLTAWRVAGAFVFSAVLSLLVFPLVEIALRQLFDVFGIDALPGAFTWGDLLLAALLGLYLGLFMGFNQYWVMRQWLPQPRGWLLISGAAAALLAPGVMYLMEALAFHPPLSFNYFALPAPQAAERAVSLWGWVGGALCGLVGGLPLAAVQSLRLPAYRRLWWLLNAAGFALAFGGLLAAANLLALFFSWGHWE